MVWTKGTEMMLVFLVMFLLQSVFSTQICSQESVTGRSVILMGKQGAGTDCSCTLQVSSSDKFAVNQINFVQSFTPTGCQYALRFELNTVQRTYSCSRHGNVQYAMYNGDIMTVKIVPGSTSAGGINFSFNITSSKAGSELSLSCQQTPPDPSDTTVTPLPTTTTPQTTSTTTSADQTTSSGGGTTSSGGGTTSSGGGTTVSGGGTTASGGGTTASGGGTTTSADKPPTPKPSVAENTNDPQIIPVSTEDTPQTTEPTSISTPAIIGATLGVILLFVVMVVVLMCLWKKKLNQNKVGAS